MLARTGRRSFGREREIGEMQRARELDGSPVGIAHDYAAGIEVGIGEGFLQGEHRGHAAVGMAEVLDPVGEGPGGEDGGQLGLGLGPLSRVVRHLLGLQVGTRQCVAQPVPELALQRPHRHVASIGGRVHVVAGQRAAERILARGAVRPRLSRASMGKMA